MPLRMTTGARCGLILYGNFQTSRKWDKRAQIEGECDERYVTMHRNQPSICIHIAHNLHAYGQEQDFVGWQRNVVVDVTTSTESDSATFQKTRYLNFRK
jgi:hypothetical protein